MVQSLGELLGSLGVIQSSLLLLGAGIVAGALNVIAGGGSFLTLPVLIFLGLPPSVANGTNRIAIVLQNLGAAWSFNRHGVLDSRFLLWTIIPSTIGGVLGTWLALVISEQAFQRVLAFLMVALSLLTLWSPAERSASRPDPAAAGSSAQTFSAGQVGGLWGGFFVVGVYGGFVQAGVGFLILALTSALGLDLVRGNAVKVVTIFCFTAISLGIFAWEGKVDWLLGSVLAVGSLVGGLWGVHLTLLKGHLWVRRAVTVMAIVFAIGLWFDK